MVEITVRGSELEDEPFRKLIVDVDDPDDAIRLITEALATQAG